MRMAAATLLVFALAACAPPEAAVDAPTEGVTVADEAAAPAISVEAAQIGGQWSFDRSCGLYDLVFTETGVDYYDYADASHVVSYNGTWAIARDSIIVLAVRRLDAQGAPTGDTLTYFFTVTAPVTTDLVGSFGPESGPTREINAKQCAFEDRE